MRNNRTSVRTAAVAVAVAFGIVLIPRPVHASSQTHTIFAYGNANNPAKTVASLPSVVRGVSWTFRWAVVEPTQGTYNWTSIDAALAASAASGRTSMIRVIAGQDSPSWVAPTVTFYDVPGGTQPPHNVTMPIPWSQGFLTAWTQFIAAYGARYNGDSRLFAVQMPGAGILGEMGLGGWLSSSPTPQSLGATDQGFITAWTTIMDAAHTAFPATPTVLDTGDPLMDGNVLPAILTHLKTYGAMAFLQQNSLSPTTSGKIVSTLTNDSAYTKVGWQTWAGGQTAKQLSAELMIATSTNSSYVELYATDCANKANLSTLTAFAG